MNQFDSVVGHCMEQLSRCHTMCLSMAMTHCIEVGGEHARPQHLRLMLDCAAFCALAGDFLARKSQFHNGVCGYAADICDTCAADCDRLDGMEECAAMCRETAAQCRTVAKIHRAEVLGMASRLAPN